LHEPSPRRADQALIIALGFLVADDRDRVVLAERLARIETGFESLSHDLAELRGWLTQIVNELKSQNEKGDKKLTELLVDYATRCAQLESARLKVKALEQRMTAIERLMPAIRAMMWVAAALGASVIALIWALITGQARVLFK